jgi:hypothetical protein
MARQRRVVFGRINRRNQTLGMRSFAEDMLTLADSRRTTAIIEGTAERAEQTWYAADMQLVVTGDFMIGVAGFSVNEEKRFFDNEEWSWLKGPTENSDAASQETVVPFAVDLREHNRWVAHATTGRIPPTRFRPAFARVLSAAAANAQLMAADWECDPVMSRRTVREWLANHPRVKSVKRTISFSNPGLDLDDDREKMRALRARRMTEEFAAYPTRDLNVESSVFEPMLNGLETGDVRLQMEARVAGGVTAKFDSEESADHSYIDDYGTDLQRGMELVLRSLVDYAETRPNGDSV